MKITFPILCAIGLFNSPLSLANRITSPQNPSARCTKPIPDFNCQTLQDKALSSGCITQEEYQTLRGIGSAPFCDSALMDDSQKPLDQLASWCPCGCFHPHTEIRSILNSSQTQEPFQEAVDIAKAPHLYSVAHLHPQSSLNHPQITYSGIAQSTSGTELKELIVLSLSTGRTLKVTTEHAVLLKSGKMVQAQDLKVNDVLMDHLGQAVDVEAIAKERFNDDVVNFSIKTKNPIEHILFAEGVAVGDLLWQSTLQDQLNQVLIRQ